MALTPDEIERRTFPIADWGYDRGEVHKFLVEVAATLRYAHYSLGTTGGVVVEGAHARLAPDAPPAHTTVARTTVDPAATPPIPTLPTEQDAGAAPTVQVAPVEPEPTPTPLPPEMAGLITEDGTPDFTKVGAQVSKILEAAETLAAGLRADAERDAIEVRAEAEKAAADRMREVDEDVKAIRDQAKRVLVAAQEQSARLTAEAEDEVLAMRAAAEQRLQARSERIQRVAQQHADRVIRFELDAVRRLEDARADLQRAVEQFTGSEERPVLDFSTMRVRTGSIEVADEDGDDAFDILPDPVAPVAVSGRATVDPVGADPVSNLVKAAVERAVEHSAPRRGAETVPTTDT